MNVTQKVDGNIKGLRRKPTLKRHKNIPTTKLQHIDTTQGQGQGQGQ